MQIKFPALTFPAFKIGRGQLLNVSLLGVSLVVPPWDITFWEAKPLTQEFVIFDSEAVAKDLAGTFGAIPTALINTLQSWLQSQVEDYYAHLKKEE